MAHLAHPLHHKEVEQLCLCLTVLNVTRLAPPPLLTLARLCMATAAVRISLNPVLLPALPLRRRGQELHESREVGAAAGRRMASTRSPDLLHHAMGIQWCCCSQKGRNRVFHLQAGPTGTTCAVTVIPSSAFLQSNTNIEQFHPFKQTSTQNHSIPQTRVGLIPSISLSNQMDLKYPPNYLIF
ncbi:DENN domain and WD repeat-containing protein SCD1 [Zea mays]|jgi:hypothetical protein|uniref:DENN domain and WD repeat-containing protein SCD1 n=1 Tax=Zea mays TaxID=4577 RepID=A0A1D6NK40_MAIZE|nr:DENN domain and WD repeat-containing protein SCD1 [Zea mays]